MSLDQLLDTSTYEKNKDTNVYLPKDYHIFVKPNDYEMTTRQINAHKEYSNLIQWGRRNPVLFAEEIFGIEMMDFQKYIFMMSWNTANVVWCMSRNAGKSTLAAVFLMAKSMLIDNFTSYILCGVGSQSIEMYSKLEKIVKKEIPSFTTLTDVYGSEIIKNHSNKDGFVHNPASYHHKLYNGAQIFTLNGAYDNNRSKRSNLNVYDECGFSPDELFATSEPFTTQDSRFKLGTNQDNDNMLMEPIPFANQLLYCSSASSTDQYFFKKYRECSIRMDAGDPRYFCADVPCDVVLKATKRGIGLPVALLTQDKIDSALRKDKETAMREYMNIFTTEGGDGQIIKRATIIKNSKNRPPLLFNDTGNKKFGIAYDPARSYDNSAVGVAEYYEDPKVGWKMRIVNVTCLQDWMSEKKIPMNTPNQIKEIKRMLIDYNGEQRADYENIIKFLIDSGSGGAGKNIADFFMEDWKDDRGNMHRGLIDPVENPGDVRNFPDAIKGKLELVSPSKYKSEMYESLIEMMNLGLIEFTNDYDGRGYLNLLYKIDKNGNREFIDHYPSENEMEKYEKEGTRIETKIYKLDTYEEIALKQIDFTKHELVNMYRYKQANGKDRFDLASDKANKMHDDRAYVIALLGWQLSRLRREQFTKRSRKKKDYKHYIKATPAKKTWKSFG